MRLATNGPRTLSIDVGGTGLKASVLNGHGKMIVPRVWVDTPYPCPPKVLLAALINLVEPLPAFDRISVGFPGYVRHDTVITAPHFGDRLWCGFNLVKAVEAKFKRPVRLLNDADMQGLAAIEGKGLELVVTLGTGVGTAFFLEGELMPHLELAHHPVSDGKTYNHYVGKKALKKIGKVQWNRRVRRVLNILSALFHYNRIYIGGGNARNITFKLDADMKIISNQDGILGGFMLWQTKPKLPPIKEAWASRKIGRQRSRCNHSASRTGQFTPGLNYAMRRQCAKERHDYGSPA